MRRDDRTIRWLALACAVATSGCSPQGDPSTGTHIGNPARVQTTATSSLSRTEGIDELVFEDARTTRYTLIQASILVDEIELSLPVDVTCVDVSEELDGGAVCQSSGERAEDEIEVEGPFVIDLVNGTSQPDLSSVRIPNLDYTHIDYRLVDRPFTAKAEFVHEGESVALDLTLRFDGGVRFKPQGGSGDTYALELDAARWLEDLDVEGCLEEGELEVVEGQVSIEDGATVCRGIAQSIETNIAGSGRVIRR